MLTGTGKSCMRTRNTTLSKTTEVKFVKTKFCPRGEILRLEKQVLLWSVAAYPEKTSDWSRDPSYVGGSALSIGRGAHIILGEARHRGELAKLNLAVKAVVIVLCVQGMMWSEKGRSLRVRQVITDRRSYPILVSGFSCRNAGFIDLSAAPPPPPCNSLASNKRQSGTKSKEQSGGNVYGPSL